MPTPITLTSPLPADDLSVEAMDAFEGLSVLGEMRLTLLSAKPNLNPNDLLGKPLSARVLRRDESPRFFNGYVTRFGIDGASGRHYRYRAVVRPWLWFLTRTADCRIFQDMTVPDIVKKVFADHGIANFEFQLFRSYRSWVYCVQYRETDYNFVARLLEHEGIYWYFEHAEGGHKLRLVDSQAAHDAVPNYESLPYFPNEGTAPPDTDSVSQWAFDGAVQSGRVVLRSFDFERPSVMLEGKGRKARSYSLSDAEIFDWQGDWLQAADGTQVAEDRVDEAQTGFEQAEASCDSHGVTVGHLLKLERHPQADQNAEYLVVSHSVRAHVAALESSESAGSSYRCDFAVIPSSQQYRAPRRTPKPFVQGPQTAVVVGPAGEEIFTDKYGRVKVQFFWDREGKKNDKSSCWVRVSQPWAGKNFGMIHIPRIGQEVVVDFLEGDPDQPLVTGRVYNAEQMPPWALPANATQSGILTRSSKGGSAANANAIRFEDKKGAEQLWIHAEKNQDIEVENDETHSVGHDRSKTIGHDETTTVKHDRTETVGNNETITIGVNRTESVGANEKIAIGANRNETVGANETIGIGANRVETVGANETITIGSNRTISVGGSETATVALQRTHAVGINETIAIGAAQEVVIGAMQSITVGANQSTSVGASQSNSIGASQSNTVGVGQTNEIGADRSLTVGGAQSTSVGKARSTSIGEDDQLTVGKNLVISAADSISLETGSASITMKKDGTITIKGKDITVQGSGKINVKAGDDIVLKGSKILQN